MRITKKFLTLLLAGFLMILNMGAISVSATNSTPIATVSAGSATIIQGEGTENVSIPINFSGSVKLCLLQVQVEFDDSVKFVSYVAGDCYTAGTVMFPPIAGSNPVGIGWMDNAYMGVQFSTGTFATLTFEVPKSEVKDYEFTVIIETCEDDSYTQCGDLIKTVNGVISVVENTTPQGPVVKFTNGTTEVEDVVDGTMELSVELNGDESDMIIFAIYAENGEYPTMEYSQEATIVDGKAIATINNITLVNGVDYYAKAFLWDGTTYYGTSYTIGK